MALDWRALGYAAAIESGLLVLAGFGGPHGDLGAVPWMFQLPGILLALYPPGGTYFTLRAAGMFLIQLGLWYAVIAALRRRGRAKLRSPRS